MDRTHPCFATSLLFCANAAYAVLQAKVSGGEAPNGRGALGDEVKFETRPCDPSRDGDCSLESTGTEIVPNEQSSSPNDAVKPEVAAKSEDKAEVENEAEPEATGDDSDSSRA